tara:strand:+ start:334 stop:705 length:372 start_codon:yes stop_codon:yes gene_type:complete
MATSGFSMQNGGVKTGMTALAGGAAPTLAANTLDAINVVTVVASDNDSVILPAGIPQGGVVWVFNQDSAQDIKVYPNTGATVNGGTATTQSLVVGQTQGLVCVQVGTDGLTWLGLLGAVLTPT